MEQSALETELIEGVRMGRKQYGTANESNQLQRLGEITKRLSRTDPSTPHFDDIQFLLFLANQQAHAIHKLEHKIDEGILESFKAQLKNTCPNLRLPYEPLDSIKFALPVSTYSIDDIISKLHAHRQNSIVEVLA